MPFALFLKKIVDSNGRRLPSSDLPHVSKLCSDSRSLDSRHCSSRGQALRGIEGRPHGFTLIELVAFITIIAVGLAGILGAVNYAVRNSADPMILKQQIAIAESLLEEVVKKPFTYCDPNDANVLTAGSAAGCTTAQSTSATAGQTRYSSTTPFNNVGDYNSFSMTGIRSPTDGSVILSGLDSYSASISVSEVGGIAPLASLASTAALRIDVTVTQDGRSITLTGYRLRYAPNSP